MRAPRLTDDVCSECGYLALYEIGRLIVCSYCSTVRRDYGAPAGEVGSSVLAALPTGPVVPLGGGRGTAT
jgi:hypothetical protein